MLSDCEEEERLELGDLEDRSHLYLRCNGRIVAMPARSSRTNSAASAAAVSCCHEKRFQLKTMTG